MQLSIFVEPRHIIPISGKDSLATALIQTTHEPSLPYEFIFNDTGAELPEVYEWLSGVEQKTGFKIQRIGVNLEEVIGTFGGYLPSTQARYCTKYTKIKPTDAYIGRDPAFVYYGLRADEDRVGYIPTGRSNITPVYPLRNKGLGIAHVYAILEAQKLTPPDFFWERLYATVCDRFPPEKWSRRPEGWQFRRLFAGRTRANCYFCFFQRLIEFLWLYEVHPDYFEKARSFEKADYTWIKDRPLSSYDDPIFRDRLFHRHVKKVCGILSGNGKATLDSEIARTSCGLICGK